MNEEPTGTHAQVNDASSLIDFVRKQKKRYARKRLLALFGLGVFLLGLSVGLRDFLTPPCQCSPPGPVAKTALSNLTIRYYSPDTLEVGTPATFSVSIFNKEIPHPLEPEERVLTANPRVLPATPFPNGTPDVPLSRAFGSGYMVFAYAQLDMSPSSKFDLPQVRQDSQSLEQAILSFDWTITPKETTQAVIAVTIIGQWKPLGTGNEIDIPLWKYRQSYDISTPEPFIKQAFTTFGGALYAIVPIFGGLGLSIPWVLVQIQKKRKKQKPSLKKRAQRGRKRG